MKKFYLAALTVLFLCLTSQAQNTKGVVKGFLQDSLSAQPLTDATISVTRTKDSSLISFTVSDKSGHFEIKGLEGDSYKLVVSFTGYQAKSKSFTINPSNLEADLATLKLDRVYKTMDEVIVTDQVPI